MAHRWLQLDSKSLKALPVLLSFFGSIALDEQERIDPFSHMWKSQTEFVEKLELPGEAWNGDECNEK